MESPKTSQKLDLFSNLPIETWSLVFQFCLPSNTEPPLSPERALLFAPFLPLSISRSLRQIALADPSLFTRLSLTIPSTKLVTGVLHAIEICFSRRSVARVMRDEREKKEYLPLELTLIAPPNFEQDQWYEKFPNLVVSAVIPYRERFTYLKLHLPQLQYGGLFLLPPGSFPKLQYLKLLGVSWSNFPPRDQLLSGLHDAIELRTLHLDIYNEGKHIPSPPEVELFNFWRPQRSGIRWNVVQDLNLVSVPIHGKDLLILLGASRSLVSGQFSVYNAPVSHVTTQIPPEQVAIPTMRHLRLFPVGKGALQIFRYLKLVSLRSLDITDPNDWSYLSITDDLTDGQPTVPLRELQRWLCSSAASTELMSLRIRICSWQLSKEVNEVLSVIFAPPFLPLLRHLHVDIPNVDAKAFLSHLVVRKNDDPWLPLLHTLFLGGCSTPSNPGPQVPAAPPSPSRGSRGHSFAKIKSPLTKLVNSRKKLALKTVYVETKGPVLKEAKVDFCQSLTQNQQIQTSMKKVLVQAIQMKHNIVRHRRRGFVDIDDVFLSPEGGQVL
ncbi:hypothetical protein DL96DRAFT_1593800, partial [Flagelloscypha sp. PMI_526]